jgi:transmembrane sensor
MDKAELQYLASRFLNNKANAKEKDKLHNWFEAGLVDAEEFVYTQENEDAEAVKSRLFTAINEKLTQESKIKITRKSKLWYYISVAATVLVIMGAALFYLKQYQSRLKPAIAAVKDVNPGGNKATLTLDNGQVINLSDADNGKLTEVAGIVITKTKDGQLVYDMHNAVTKESNGQPVKVSYSTISTPRGGQYQLILPDGTRVWLNAASSLRFPSSFAGLPIRNVELSGEAYFEVKKDKTQPFKVINSNIAGRNQVIEVLGTHFNVNAYPDEEVTKTTLLEGRLRVAQGALDVAMSKSSIGNGLILRPGQQSVLDKNSLNEMDISDAEESIAWKNGYFQFSHADLEATMRQISRWYDVKIRYEGSIPNLEFGGGIQKSLTLGQVLKILNKSEVHFRMEGREVIVMP